jgi:hypothetical protein
MVTERELYDVVWHHVCVWGWNKTQYFAHWEGDGIASGHGPYIVLGTLPLELLGEVAADLKPAAFGHKADVSVIHPTLTSQSLSLPSPESPCWQITIKFWGDSTPYFNFITKIAGEEPHHHAPHGWRLGGHGA